MTENKLRESICRVGESLYQRGYVHATAGNISVKLADGFLITPTDACLGALDPATLAKVSAAGVQISGARASKTLTLHRAIYDATHAYASGARAVLHTHSTHLVALTLAGVWTDDDILPPITPYYLMKVGHVPRIPYHRPGDPVVAELVTHRIRHFASTQKALRAVMLDRLGPTVWHDSAESASACLEELEETARVWLLSGRSCAPLSEQQIEDLRSAFGVNW
jgi:3-dehydro-4-phosphotetronate decarboxylase